MVSILRLVLWAVVGASVLKAVVLGNPFDVAVLVDSAVIAGLLDCVVIES